ncbi:adenosylcobinamide-GDP ribazoletransferase [Gemmobacter denitrificans]|uniref:Adenosylcobinamide-GDP ribazoletransferase n=1 Tax=Gemmobacter denitrificans TaxID=3123040 RepID=A0ABU8BS87_9RHOB
MAGNDPSGIVTRGLHDLRAGLGLLSRLPLPPLSDWPNPPAVWAWPLAGLVLGALALAGGAAALAFGLSPGLAAALMLMLGTVMTGAMHEDGLADSCDGLWGGWDRDRRLAIMKDSHIGSYGVMGLVLVTLARWSALSALLAVGHWGAALAAAAISRAPMAVLMAALPNARGGGLSASVGRPSQDAAAAACGVALLAGLICTGWVALAMAAAATVVGWLLARIALRKIGGQTGDILGATQQLTELAALACATALLT